jgi:hypothetical protein
VAIHDEKGFALSVEGGEALIKMLRTLERRGQRDFKNAVKRTERAQLAPMRAKARAEAPKLSGRLKRAINLREWRGRSRSQIAFELYIRAGGSRSDPRGAFYGWMVERGHKTRGGKSAVPGRHMLLRTYEAYGRQAGDTLRATIMGLIDAAVNAGGSGTR